MALHQSPPRLAMSSLWDDWIISSIPEASNLGQHADTRWPLGALLTNGTHNLLSDTSYTPSLLLQTAEQLHPAKDNWCILLSMPQIDPKHVSKGVPEPVIYQLITTKENEDKTKTKTLAWYMGYIVDVLSGFMSLSIQVPTPGVRIQVLAAPFHTFLPDVSKLKLMFFN